MSVTVVIGLQWGDEGKGKVVVALIEKEEFDMGVRYQGGNNAGHTYVDEKGNCIIFHFLPSIAALPNKIAVVGAGVVVEPKALMNEFLDLRRLGIKIKGRVFIDSRVPIIGVHHRVLDSAEEIARQKETNKKIGTTARGIGPAYEDLVRRTAIHMTDFLAMGKLPKLLERRTVEIANYIFEVLRISLNDFKKIFEDLTEKERKANRHLLEAGLLTPELTNYTRFYSHPNYFNLEAILTDYQRIAEKLRKDNCICDTSLLVNQAIADDKKVLFEGAQGSHLDVLFGTRPYVTSSHTLAGSACIGTGIGPTRINEVIGVVKTITTRVGGGPFPTQMPEELAQTLRGDPLKVDAEFGATTRRPRRLGWPDAVIARTSAMWNGITKIVFTKLDFLDTLSEIKICTAYRLDGKTIHFVPPDPNLLDKVEPIYETLAGWQTPTSDARKWWDLPPNTRFFLEKYLELIKQAPGLGKIKIKAVSVGPRGDQIILL